MYFLLLGFAGSFYFIWSLKAQLNNSIQQLQREIESTGEVSNKKSKEFECEIGVIRKISDEKSKEFECEVEALREILNEKGKEFECEIESIRKNSDETSKEFECEIESIRKISDEKSKELECEIESIRKISDENSKEFECEIESIRKCLNEKSKEFECELAVGRVADVEQLSMMLAITTAAKYDLNQGFQMLNRTLHGHSALILVLLCDILKGVKREKGNGFHVIEIGSTREKFWTQGSSGRISAVCRAFGMTFKSVDIDPKNTENVIDIKKFYGNSLEAETMAGESFLEEYKGSLPPYIYIDAYDYDHGKHSKERQERYEVLQGGKISDEACWKMHYDCAVQFVEKCPNEGVVVFDDVFYENNEWLGKGKTAVPYMLDNGFELEARTGNTLVLRKVAQVTA
ncbi:hypothetical protein GCM10007877_26790 [Marinibactrum halimedae]|uniref:Uncharacterized protein n=2 Tax=Marinibactrum halimedae TaxID=1444977 RepID=A0AA37WN48_9GAMM|nr:hypothetical protein GCM10007877_26790 [Marinibactrum halimedae]